MEFVAAMREPNVQISLCLEIDHQTSQSLHASKYLPTHLSTPPTTSVRRCISSRTANSGQTNKQPCQYTTGRPSSIKSPSRACLVLNRKGPGRLSGVWWCVTPSCPVLSSPSGRQARRLGSGFGKGGRNLVGDKISRETDEQRAPDINNVCSSPVVWWLLALGPASEPILHTRRRDDVLCVLSGTVCVCPSTSQGKSTRLD